jgi:hypothetical protein
MHEGLDTGKPFYNLYAQRKATLTLSGVVRNHPDLTVFILDQVQGEHSLVSHGRRIAG